MAQNFFYFSEFGTRLIICICRYDLKQGTANFYSDTFLLPLPRRCLFILVLSLSIVWLAASAMFLFFSRRFFFLPSVIMLDMIIEVPTWSKISGRLFVAPRHRRVPGIPPHLTSPIGVLASDCRCSPLLGSSQALVSVNLLLLFELRLKPCILCHVASWVCGFFMGLFLLSYSVNASFWFHL